MLGLEAGQSAFGDVLAWFKELLLWPVKQNPHLSEEIKETIADDLIPNLSEAAARLPLDVNAVVALDWINGRRTPDANQALKGAIMGMNMGSSSCYLQSARGVHLLWLQTDCGPIQRRRRDHQAGGWPGRDG